MFYRDIRSKLAALVCISVVGCATSGRQEVGDISAFVVPSTYRIAATVNSRVPGAESRVSIRQSNSESASTSVCGGDTHIEMLLVTDLDKRYASCIQDSSDWFGISIGFVGLAIVSAQEAPGVAFELGDLAAALEVEVRLENGSEHKPNAAQVWSDVNPTMPPMSIRVFGPSPESSSGQLFQEMLLKDDSCQSGQIAQDRENWSGGQGASGCQRIRADGAYVSTTDDPATVVEELESNSMSLAIVDFQTLEKYSNRIKGLPVEGVFPSSEAVLKGSYPLSQPVTLYLKSKNGVIDEATVAFISEILSDKASGSAGYLVDLGLIPLGDTLRRQNTQGFNNFLASQSAVE